MSNEMGIFALGEVGGSLMETKDDSRWEAYDWSASASSVGWSDGGRGHKTRTDSLLTWS